MPFHCHGHDAIELDHVYHGAESQAGYQGVCAAQRAVALAAPVMYTQGEEDFH